MQFHFDVASSSNQPPGPTQKPSVEAMTEILRQMLELQRTSLAQLVQLQQDALNHAKSTAQDNLARWRNLISRWQTVYPDFAGHCKKIYPVMEKAYVHMLANLTEELVGQEEEALENDFAVQEFLDKYGMRVGQLSHLLSIIGPLAEAANQGEAK